MGSETEQVPKPMLTVGGRPLLWHVMHTVALTEDQEFIIAVGHLGHVVKDFFLRFDAFVGDFTKVLGQDVPIRHSASFPEAEWRVTCVDTGQEAGTGARLRDAACHVSSWPILVAYGDVLTDVDIGALLRFHRRHGRLATVTAVRPPSRYGVLKLARDGIVADFAEKTPPGADWVSAGFFVLERAAVEGYIPTGRDVMFEQEPVRRLVQDGQLAAYEHHGPWRPVDTLEDLAGARGEWDAGTAPWRTWKS